MKLYVIRHGETLANEEGRLQGWSDDPLNSNGIILARQTAQALKGLRFDAAYSSPLKRALETARIILEGSGNENVLIQTDERLKEINAGDYERKRIQEGQCEIDSRFICDYFKNPFLVGGFPGGESVEKVITRTQQFLKEIVQDREAHILISTHGFALRAMLNFLYSDPADFWHGHLPYNCSVSIVEYANRHFTLVADDVVFYYRALFIDRYTYYA